ncbi:MAG TPA: NAD(P)H-hydrate epimerase [Planctomycetes bacterium]|nr:NAD(P)H-hydrate epimerase [Planctomycetota bacterium]
MSNEPLPRAIVRAIDRRAIEEFGVPSLTLMENAGTACAREAQAMLRAIPGRSSGPVLVLAGPGNNGGDGFVVARILAGEGVAVRTVFVGPAEKLEGGGSDVRTNHARLLDAGESVEILEASEDWRAELSSPEAPVLIVDALFGTGLTRPLRSPWLEVVQTVNDLRGQGALVLAVDLPSGLDADSGEVLGAVVRADVTVTFVAPKLGFGNGAGPDSTGRVVVADIGIPPEAY